MATKETTNYPTPTVQDLVERLVSALDARSKAGSTDGNRITETLSLSAEAEAAIASFAKTARELAVLPPK